MRSAHVCLCSLTLRAPQREVRWMAFAPNRWKLRWGCCLLCIHQIVRLHVLFCTFENGKISPVDSLQIADHKQIRQVLSSRWVAAHITAVGQRSQEKLETSDCAVSLRELEALWRFGWGRPDHCSSSKEAALTTVMGTFLPTVWRAALQLDDLNSTIMWTQTWRWYKRVSLYLLPGKLKSGFIQEQIWATVNCFRHILDSQKGFLV